jgi:hypothetical protein
MHYLSSVYSVTIPLNVSGLLVAHQQEVSICICDSWYVLYVESTVGGPSQLSHTHTHTHIYIYIYILLAPDDGILTSPEHIEVQYSTEDKKMHQVGFITRIYGYSGQQNIK